MKSNRVSQQSQQDANAGSALPKRSLDGRKILVIVENLPVPFDRRVWQEARALHAAGAQVTVICPAIKGYEQKFECLEGINIYRHPLPTEGTGKLQYIWEYATALFWQTILSWRILFKHGFDTIHGCNPPDLIFLIALQFKILGKKFVFDHHDINPELYEAKFGKRGFFWKAMVFCEWLTFKSANVVISTNESYRNIALTRGAKNPDDVFIVRSGPDLSRIRRLPPNQKWRNGRKFLVGYVGVMGESEGIDLLLESAKHVIAKQLRQDIQFVLVGSGPALASLRIQSEKMGVSDFVTFAGRLPDDDLFEILSTADLCVNPDRVTEMNDKSTMNKILEYMALGKAIVQFDVTEGRVSAQKASLYAKANDPIDFADKMLELIENPKLRQEMGDFGRHRIETQMAWEFEAPKLIRAYEHQ